jgi:hypothetical protein
MVENGNDDSRMRMGVFFFLFFPTQHCWLNRGQSESAVRPGLVSAEEKNSAFEKGFQVF